MFFLNVIINSKAWFKNGIYAREIGMDYTHAKFRKDAPFWRWIALYNGKGMTSFLRLLHTGPDVRVAGLRGGVILVLLVKLPVVKVVDLLAGWKYPLIFPLFDLSMKKFTRSENPAICCAKLQVFPRRRCKVRNINGRTYSETDGVLGLGPIIYGLGRTTSLLLVKFQVC